MAIESVNPATGQRLRTFDPEGAAAVEDKLGRAATAFRAWSRRPLGERAAVLARAGEILEAERQAFGRLMTLEMGKLAGAAADEAAKCTTACRYYAERGAAFLQPEKVESAAGGLTGRGGLRGARRWPSRSSVPDRLAGARREDHPTACASARW